jgi:hypothetical protein
VQSESPVTVGSKRGWHSCRTLDAGRNPAGAAGPKYRLEQRDNVQGFAFFRVGHHRKRDVSSASASNVMLETRRSGLPRLTAVSRKPRTTVTDLQKPQDLIQGFNPLRTGTHGHRADNSAIRAPLAGPPIAPSTFLQQNTGEVLV